MVFEVIAMRRLLIWFVGLFPIAYLASGLKMVLDSIEPPYSIGDYIGYIVVIGIELAILAWFTYPIWGFVLYTFRAYKRLQKRGRPSILKALKIGAKLTFSGPRVPRYRQQVMRSVATGFSAGGSLFKDDLIDEMVEMGYFGEY